MAAPSPGLTASNANLPKVLPKNSLSTWTNHQNKLFEEALAKVEETRPNRWMHVARMVPGKDAMEMKQHYDLLVEDVLSIEAGLVPLPDYNPDVEGETFLTGSGNCLKKPLGPHLTSAGSYNKVSSGKQSEQERRKGVPWTEEEHRLFLLGLDKFGKGDWRSISRNFVVSRTPTQVASHAQKYFIRQNSLSKDNKRRSSIHDITSVNGSDMVFSATPASSSSPQSSMGQPSLRAQSPLSMPPVYASHVVGQPLMATPVLLHSPPAFPLMHGTPIPSSSIPMPHLAYPMPQPAMHH